MVCCGAPRRGLATQSCIIKFNASFCGLTRIKFRVFTFSLVIQKDFRLSTCCLTHTELHVPVWVHAPVLHILLLWEGIRPLCQIGFGPVQNYLARYFRTGPMPIWQSGLSRSTDPFPQDLKRSPVRTLLTASLNRGATPWEWTEARMGVRLLGRAMLGQTVVCGNG